eukprot:XP_001705090.1 Hypothetical protein GL50803_33956 [Giardia lamblia ATCC 50803]
MCRLLRLSLRIRFFAHFALIISFSKSFSCTVLLPFNAVLLMMQNTDSHQYGGGYKAHNTAPGHCTRGAGRAGGVLHPH